MNFSLFKSFFVRFSILILVLLVIFGGVALGEGKYNSNSSLDPLLDYLVDRNEALRKETGQGINLSSFSESLSLYRKDEPLQDLVLSGGKEPLEGPKRATGVGIIFKTKEHLMPFTQKGVSVHSVMGDLATAHATLAGIKGLMKNPRVEYVARSRILRPQLNKSVPAIEADVLHSNQPVDKGKGVVVGVVDTGIDYSDRDFRVEEKDDGTNEETSRIRFIWDQTSAYGISPFQYSYGTEYTKSQIEYDIKNGNGPSAGEVREKDSEGHGTHVSGIAVGDGSSSDAGYVGVAPGASLISVDTLFTSSSVIDGVKYIKEKTDQLGLPGVVNLSLGTQAGPHDGTSLLEQSIDRLSGGDFLITVAAGNSGNVPIHKKISLSSGSIGSATFEVPVFSSSSTYGDYVELEGYYGSSGNIEAKVVGPGGVETDWVGLGEIVQYETGKGNVIISNGPSEVSDSNQLYFRIGDTGTDSPPAEGEWELRFRGVKSSTLDIWVTEVLLGGEYRDLGFGDGDSQSTIAEPGNAHSVITVGSFNTKNSWNGNVISGYPIGELSDFSSRGPTRDGRKKPDLVAPGAWVVSTLSESYDPPSFYMASDGKHYASAGTSMAAPHVAGSAALIWHAAPELTRSEVKDTITSTPDSVSSGGTENDWGSGKLNARKSVYSTGVPEVQGEEGLWIKATPNPAKKEVSFYFNVPESVSEANIKIFNILGKPVKTISSGKIGGGEMKYTWDLENDSGAKLANGLYVYILEGEGRRSGLHRLVIRR